MPKVSVCIPTYNTARYLPEAIESVLAQSYTDYELIVVDNASTDATPELCRRFTDHRLRTVRFDELVGQAENWNRCLALASGELVVLLHADDRLDPAYLARAVAVMDDHSEVGLVHCATRLIDTTGAPTGQTKTDGGDRIDPGEVTLRRLLLEGCVINPAGVLVRRSVYQAVGEFTTAIVWGVDWHMWARAALAGHVAYIAECLADYRLHPESGTSGVMATGRNSRDELWLIEDLFRLIPAQQEDLHALRPEAIRRAAHRTWCHAEEMCRRGFGRPTRLGIRGAVRIYPPILFEGRVWCLWVASFLGYDWFTLFHRWRRLIKLNSV